MQKIFFWLFILFFLFSCTVKKTDYSGEYFRILKNGKYALFNAKGKQLTKPLYESSTFVSDGYLATKKGGKWGFLDKAGNEVIPFRYRWVSNFKDGSAVVFTGEKKAGFIDKNGTFIIPPSFHFAKNFSEGLAAVEINNKWGYVNKKGKIVIPLIYDIAGDFKNDKANIWIQKDDKIIKCTLYKNGLKKCN